MAGYTKLFSKILNSSIWNETNETRILWVTMLAMCDQHGFVEAAPNALAHQARISMDAFKESIEILESPDEYSGSKEYDGRRVSRCDGGWVVLNYEKYRGKLLNSKENEQARERMRKHRAKLAGEDIEESEQSVTLRNSASACASSSLEESFNRCWKAYPDKSGSKHKALQAYKQAKPIEADVLAGIDRYKRYVDAEHKRGFKDLKYANGQTWFNQRRWESEYVVEGGKSQEELDLIKRRMCI